MVIGAAGIAVAVILLGGAESAPANESDQAVRTALEHGGYPWYDAKQDAAEPVLPGGQGSSDWLEGWLGSSSSQNASGRATTSTGWGELFVIGLVVLALTFLLVILAELWRRYRPAADEELAETASTGGVGRIAGLPAGVRPETEDPWAEAIACRERGDRARAVVCLFAHQLLTLERRRIVRLSPGRTGRQLVRTIDDRPLRQCVESTLRLFEMVYYGHRVPSGDEFDAVWSLAEDFERRIAGGLER